MKNIIVAKYIETCRNRRKNIIRDEIRVEGGIKI